MSETKICPYPGLRPFNDDEAIFFKGREHNIEVIVELFEKKKFMMLTGASGDGKSSLIYAGVVPHARAGLFKAKFNSWAVADFRPERDPLGNLARALNKFFKYEDFEAFRKELSYGFSSLIDIYKRSPLYLNTESKEYIEADDKEKKALKRKASNLLIMADQFEEFFTNNENYHNGIASVESQTVVNLLLETAKLALANDIPIYIICTMRSDYIGQCAAFRGLPEYIGFSQFFVPRLKRNEITQVIEEPAMLNGDRINHRLTERLLNDITEGYDQLPILQHALNQIWKAAKNGEEEMDLLHYAMVGGLPEDQLPEAERKRFREWYETLPEFKKELFKHPSLENILNAHANELLEKAWEKFSARGQRPSEISPEKVKLIIKATFQCLTKIDEARAVRNRMTIQEITDIIADPEINHETVGKVLDVFREQGNTFIRPFITEDPATHSTQKDSVLDITHESLIRNWTLLTDWANEEYDNWLNWQDFNKQLNRWVENRKAKGYLLPIGPLTFFENWYNTVKPNKYWLSRYDESELSKEEKLEKAEETLKNAREFIKRSARSLFFSRTVLKYGANKLLAYTGVVVLITWCTFYYFDFRKKQNDVVISRIEDRGVKLLGSNKVSNKIKAHFLIAYERLHPGTFVSLLEGIHNDTLAYDISYSIFENIDIRGEQKKRKRNPMLFQTVDFMHRIISQGLENKSNYGNDKFYKRFSEFTRMFVYLKTNFTAHDEFNTTLQENIDKLYRNYILVKLSETKDTVPYNSRLLNSAIELVMAYSAKNTAYSREILNLIDPFGNDQQKKQFKKLYPTDRKFKVDWSNTISHNGGYQIAAYLFAHKGDEEKINFCLDTVIKYNKEYKDFYNMNFQSLANHLFCSGLFSNEQLDRIYARFEAYSKFNHLRLLQMTVNNVPLVSRWEIKSNDQSYPESSLAFALTGSSPSVISYYKHAIEKENTDPQIRKFYLATLSKRLAFNEFHYYDNPGKGEELMSAALDLFCSLPEDIVNAEFELGEPSMTSTKKIKRFEFFLYPTIIEENSTWNPYWTNIDFSPYFLSFVELATRKNVMFNSSEKAKLYEKYLFNIANSYTQETQNTQRDSVILKLATIAERERGTNSFVKTSLDSNLLFLIRSFAEFQSGDTASGNAYYRKLNEKTVLSHGYQTGDEYYSNAIKSIFRKMAEHFALCGNPEKSFKILSALQEPFQRRNTLVSISLLLEDNPYVHMKFRYLDTLYSYIDKKPRFGQKLFQVNGTVGSQYMFELSMKLMKDLPDKNKPRALVQFVRGICKNGFYYNALQYIPDYVSSANELELYTEIMRAEILKNNNMSLLSLGKYSDNIFFDYDLAVFSDQWSTGDIEEGESGVTYYSTSED